MRQKKGDIIKLQAFVYDAFDHIKRIHVAGGYNGYKKTFQRVIRKIYGISRDNIQRFLEHYQVYFVNRQNFMRASLQPIVICEVLACV